MSMLKIPAALLVTGAMLVGLPAKAAPTAPRSAAAELMAQESDVVTVHFGGWGAWHHGPDVSAAMAGAANAYGGGHNDDYGYLALPYGSAAGWTPSGLRPRLWLPSLLWMGRLI